MKTVVHIGINKTGSTTLQSFLQENAARLAEQGFFYKRYSERKNHPEFLLAALHQKGDLVSLFNVVREMKVHDLDSQARIVTRFEQELDADIADTSCDTFVVSCELLGLPGRGRPFVKSLHDYLSQRFSEITYVLYIREQASWTVSAYSQGLKMESPVTLDEHLDRTKVPNFNFMVSIWEEIAGAENVKVRLFERDFLKNGDLIDDFCDTVGIHMGGLVRPEIQNQTLTLRQAKVLQRGNWLVAKFFDPGDTSHRLTQRLRSTVFKYMPAGNRRIELSESRKRDIQNEAMRSNEMLRRRRFPDRKRLFQDAPAWVRPKKHKKHNRAGSQVLPKDRSQAVQAFASDRCVSE